jgi:hypothetical protein
MKRNYGLARKIKVITAVLQKLLMRILQDWQTSQEILSWEKNRHEVRNFIKPSSLMGTWKKIQIKRTLILIVILFNFF